MPLNIRKIINESNLEDSDENIMKEFTKKIVMNLNNYRKYISIEAYERIKQETQIFGISILNSKKKNVINIKEANKYLESVPIFLEDYFELRESLFLFSFKDPKKYKQIMTYNKNNIELALDFLITIYTLARIPPPVRKKIFEGEYHHYWYYYSYIQKLNNVSDIVKNINKQDTQKDISYTIMLQKIAKDVLDIKKSLQDNSDKTKKSTKTLIKFPLPTDYKWNEVTITFDSNERITIKFRDDIKKYNYVEMGFYNKKTNTPDSLWEFFKEGFAKNNGELPPNPTSMTSKERDLLRSRVKDLRKRLKTFFDVKDDPFYPHCKYNTYKTKFILKRKSFESFKKPYTIKDYSIDDSSAIKDEGIREIYRESQQQ